MKTSKILLLFATAVSAVIQLYYGVILLADPHNIIRFLKISPGSYNEALSVLTFMYGKLFITLFLVSGAVLFFIWKDHFAGIVLTLIFGLNMVVSGLISFANSYNLVYLLADSLRGIILVALLYFYYKFNYKLKTSRNH